MIFNRIKKHKIKTISFVILIIAYYNCLPKILFAEPTSTVATAKNNELLGAVIADDGQWRFPELDSVPTKFEHCILQFEDAYFYKHFGFNPVSISKAFVENVKAKKVVRGGSTLTQQVIRLSRKNSKRSYLEKLQELVLATRLEFKYSKKEILKLYASHAPFGGNVVGLEMASWRYFGLQSHQLSWAESATLAVLPNAPSLIYPGKNQQKLKEKRNRLLLKLQQQNIIDAITYELALEEELPQKPYALPKIAPHFVQEIAKHQQGKFVKSSLDIQLQQQVNTLVSQHYYRQKQNEVYNMSVLVLDVETRKVLAYVGNSPTDNKHQKDVNNVISPRSTGSVLKPFLYAQMLQKGDLLPSQLVSDIPTEIAGYSPKNFDLKFDGAVPANEALTRSLNIPSVRLLQRYGLEKFRENLKTYQIKDIDKSADYYGLSLILGGAEASLWDLCKTFAGYAGIVNHFESNKHQYYQQEFINPVFTNDAVVLGILMSLLALVFYTASLDNKNWKKFYTVVPTVLLCYFLPALMHWPLGLIAPKWFDSNLLEFLQSKDIALTMADLRSRLLINADVVVRASLIRRWRSFSMSLLRKFPLLSTVKSNNSASCLGSLMA